MRTFKDSLVTTWTLSWLPMCLALTLVPCYGERLFVIVGTPATKNPDPNQVSLFEVAETTLELNVQSHVLGNEGFLNYIGVVPEHRIAVVARRIPNRFAVIDLDEAKVMKTCNSGPSGRIHFAEWLGYLPNGQVGLISQYTEGEEGPFGLYALTATGSETCSESVRSVMPYDLRLPLFSGQGGVGPVGGQEEFWVNVDRDGVLTRFINRESQVKFEPRIPLNTLDYQAGQTAILRVNNRAMIVISTKAKGGTRAMLYRKSDSSWRQLTLPGDASPTIRAFGRFLVLTEGLKREKESSPSPPAAETGSTLGQQPQPTPARRESPGRKAWRLGRGDHGPSIARAFDDADEIYPGILHIEDIESGKQYTISTGQADSEVVLIENGQVYYRVADELFRSEMKSEELGKPVLIAKSDVLLDAHWAFIAK